ncbi:MAG: hypothetical protein L6R42_000575 [Xanthoria sp. 1 TBL-2021]|nr:MAG: hypothetical protein L6R42_000575 [Xanthoria sp. 1 TBL-2021]
MDSPSSNEDKTCESAPQHYNRTLWQGRSKENNSPTVPNNDQGLPSAVDDLTKAGRVNTGDKRAAERSLSPTSNPKKPKTSDEYQELKTMQEDVDPPFPYAEKASKRFRCSFGDLDSETPWMVGNNDLAFLPWSLSIFIEVGRSGMPNLKLIIHADGESLETRTKTASLSWFANAFDHDGALQVEDLHYEMFHEWYDRIHDNLRNLPAIADANTANQRDAIIFIACNLQHPVLSNFKDPAHWNTVPKAVLDRFHGLVAEKQRVSFLVSAKDLQFRKLHLPLFSRHVTEGLGMLSQYTDPKTKEYSLYNMEDVPTVEQVGNGMYVQGDGKIFEMYKLYSFAFPLQFKVFAALTPIREAQNMGNKRGIHRYQAELTAVNDFCNNVFNHAPTANFHHLLMTGGQSSCNDKAILDLCGTDLENIKIFEAAVTAARSILNDDKQVGFIENLRDIRDNTLALLGPAGSGKSRLLGFVAALLSMLGHKVLVCTLGDVLVEKLGKDIVGFAMARTSTQSDWISGKKFLQVKCYDRLDEALADADDHTDLEDDVDPEWRGSDVPPDRTLRGHVRRLNAAMSGTMEHDQDNQTAIKSQLFSQLDLLLVDSRNQDFMNMVKDHYKPTVILVDDAQHLYHASLFLTLTQFLSWQALILAGDDRQIGPMIHATKRSEVVANSQITAIELLHAAGTNVFTLDTQYRMISQIADFPVKQFYNVVRNRSIADAVGQKFRNVSRKYVKNRPKGSNYFFLNVPRSLSRVTPGTDSISNHCNAKAIQVLVAELLDEGILPDDIKILCFYNAQVTLISDNFYDSNDDRLQSITIHTVGNFHGQEANITIVDFVQAYDIDLENFHFLRKHPARSNLGVGNDKITPSYHIRDYRRINTALTRAKNGLVVVGQIPLFIGKVWPGLGENANTLFLMVEYAVRRKLVYTAEDIVDEELEAVGSEDTGGNITDTQAVLAERERHQRFVNVVLRRGRKILDGKAAG